MKNRRSIYTLLTLLPIIDLVTSIQARYNVLGISVGMLLKGLIALFSVIYILFFSTSKYKKITTIYIGIMLIFVVSYFTLNNALLSMQYLLPELKYLFKILYMPILFSFFLNYFDDVGFNKAAFIKYMIIVLLEYAIFLLVPLLLNIAFESYSADLHGYVGWFYAANEVSVIMIILLPFIYYLLNNKNKYNFFVALPVLYVISCIGTKVTFMGTLFITVLSFIFYLIKYKCKINNYTLGSFFILVFTIFFFCISSNIAITNFLTLAEKQEFTFIETPVVEEINPNNEIATEPVEEKKDVKEIITKVAKLLLSARDVYYLQTKDIYFKTYKDYYPILGMGFSNTKRINNINIDKLIEIDYLDLYFHTGIFGLLIVLSPYLYTAILVLKKLFINKIARDKILLIFYNSLIVTLALGVAAIAGHVLFYPAVSIYLCLYLLFILNETGMFIKKDIDDNKVAILALHLNYGGIENVICNEANMLSEKFNVEVICLYNSHQDLPFKLNENVKITYLLDTISNKEKLKKAINDINIINILKESIKAVKILYLKPRLIKKAILNSDAKVIISTRKEFSKILGIYHRQEVITISEEHNYHKNDKNIIRSVINANKDVDYLLPTSKELSDFYLPKVNAKVVYIPNCLNYYPDKINTLTSKNMIAVGRLSKEKGFVDLIPVMKKVIKKDKEVTLDIYGDGPEKDAIKKAIIENKLQRNINLKGFVSPEKLRKVMKNYSLILCPSYEESFGLAILEAMSFGVPCVMYDTAKGPLEFVDDTNGIIIKGRNSKQMALAINSILNDKKTLKALGKASREKSLMYSYETIKDQFVNFISQMKMIDKRKKVLFVSSCGGHLTELMQLQKLFEKYDYSIITEKTKDTKNLKNIYHNRLHYLVYGTKDHKLSYPFKLLFNTLLSCVLFIKIRPSYIISTGAHTAGPICLIGKLLGSKIIFIETFANIHKPTITGRAVYKFADLFIVQWESMLEFYPNAVYGGWIF